MRAFPVLMTFVMGSILIPSARASNLEALRQENARIACLKSKEKLSEVNAGLSKLHNENLVKWAKATVVTQMTRRKNVSREIPDELLNNPELKNELRKIVGDKSILNYIKLQFEVKKEELIGFRKQANCDAAGL